MRGTSPAPHIAQDYASKYPLFLGLFRQSTVEALRKFGIDDNEPLVDCVTASYLRGIPDADMASIEAGTASHDITPEIKENFVKWLGPSTVHGQPIGFTYQDGTPRDLAAEDVVNRRFKDNARDICPALLEQYPPAFSY